jgi:hypothetical protein
LDDRFVVSGLPAGDRFEAEHGLMAWAGIVYGAITPPPCDFGTKL